MLFRHIMQLRALRAISFVVALLLVKSPAIAAEPNAAAIDAHLAAGEFAPALAPVRQADEGAARDQLLARIARAQAAGGARSAAVNTAGEIYDDRIRNVALQPMAAAGGASQADFDQLLNLIKSTVAPTTWDDVGGPGSAAPFATGVLVDASGVVHRGIRAEDNGQLAGILSKNRPREVSASVREESGLRKVSLSRLERRVQMRLAAGQQPTEEMKYLAGLQRINYVLVYPETGDVVIAGPAGDWRPDAEGRVVSKDTGRPVVQLDDLVVVLRHAYKSDKPYFGCAIKPSQAALKRAQDFLTEWNTKAVKPGKRGKWLADLRDQLGKQDIEVWGVDPRTRVGRVMIEADYRMKLVGMGLEDGVVGVPSYLDLIKLERGENPPNLGVLRWWFSINYKAVATTAARTAYEIVGQGVKVMSENELLTPEGKRIHTGKAEMLNQEFTRNFTKHYDRLSAKYPIYADLQNIYDLGLVAQLIKREGLADRVSWHMTCFMDPKQYRVGLDNAPKKVETVVAHKVLSKTNFIAGVSGGVMVNAAKLLEQTEPQLDRSGSLESSRRSIVPKSHPRDNWWWD
ncbi:MAG: DUF1598 domain-containing protein [Pirellulales bacterium]|nr:DUF1598 domain-containing protein [Pirellulales bacterium]